MPTPIEQTYEAMHEGMANLLLERIKTGTATASDLSVARQFLKDNGVRVAGRGKSPATDELADRLPYEEEPDPAPDA